GIADVAVTKTGPATVTAFGSITYTLTATNNGPNSSTSVVLTDTLPAGVSFVSADNGGTPAGNVVTWPAFGSLPGGDNFVRTVTVMAPATGTLLNVAAASATTNDP